MTTEDVKKGGRCSRGQGLGGGGPCGVDGSGAGAGAVFHVVRVQRASRQAHALRRFVVLHQPGIRNGQNVSAVVKVANKSAQVGGT